MVDRKSVSRLSHASFISRAKQRYGDLDRVSTTANVCYVNSNTIFQRK